MKKLIKFMLLATFLSTHSYGKEQSPLLRVQQVIMGLQANYENFYPVKLFSSPERRIEEGIGTYIHYRIDKKALVNTLNANYRSIKLELPQADGTTINLLLTQHQILADDFKLLVKDEKGQHEISAPKGLYYYGMIEGYKQRSMVACSIFNNEITCVISDESGNWNLGPFEDQKSLGKGDENGYVYYNDATFHIPGDFICGTDEG